MLCTLWSKTLREYRVAILGWGIAMGLFMLASFAAATPPVRELYASIAPRFRFFFDPVALNTAEGYVTARVLQLTLPTMLSIWPILAGSRLLRGDEERGTMDVLLALPRSRVRIIGEKLLALLLALLLIACFLAAGTVAGEATGQATVDVGRAVLTALNLALLAGFFGTLALFISQFTARRAAAGAAAGLLTLAFVLDGIGRTVPGTVVQYVSPFYYYNLDRPLIPGFSNRPVGALVLLVGSTLLTVGSCLLFARRDAGRPALVWQRSGNEARHTERSLNRAAHDSWLRDITRYAIRREAWPAWWWLLGITNWCAWLVLLIPSLQAPMNKALAQSPGLAKLFSGGDTSTNEGFISVLAFGFVVVLVAIFVLSLALEWPADLEHRRLELVLSTPIARRRILLQRFGAVALLSVPAAVLAWIATSGAAAAAGLAVDQGHLVAASVSMLPPALLIAALCFALSGRLRYGAVAAIVSAYLGVAFLADFLKAALQLPDWILELSVFHLYGTPATAGLDWTAFLGMTGVALGLLALAVAQWSTLDVE